MLKKLKKLLGIFIAIIFVISFIVPSGVFGQIQQNEDMEKKCKATREGTEKGQETKKRVPDILSRQVQQVLPQLAWGLVQ